MKQYCGLGLAMVAVRLLEPPPSVGSMLRPDHPVFSSPKSTSRTREGLRQRVRPQGKIKAAGGRFVALGRDWGGWSEAGDCPFRHAAKAGYHYSLGQFRSTECLVQQCGVPSSAQDRRTYATFRS